MTSQTRQPPELIPMTLSLIHISGGQEMTGELKEVLETGKHPATATAYAIDPGTGTTVGSVETSLLITVGSG